MTEVGGGGGDPSATPDSRTPVTRICLIVENHWRAVMGGAQYQAGLIANELVSHGGFEVYYLARRCPQDTHGYPYRILRIGTDRGVRRRAVFFDARTLWRTLRRIDPDVIYQRMRQSYTGVAARYARRYDKKLVFHIAHDFDVGSGFFKEKGLSMNTPFDIVERVVGRYGLHRADEIIAQTPSQAEALQRNHGRAVTAIMPNLHPAPDAGEGLEKPQDVVEVVWAANFKITKRPELFVRLAEDFSADSSVRFVMAGRPGHAVRYRGLHERIRRAKNLRYLGELELGELNRVLAGSHVFVNTSVAEGFPNTFIQAWMRGVVVMSLSADVEGGIENLGLGYCVGDYETLRSRLAGLLCEKSKYAEMAERARAYALERYSTKNFHRLIDVLSPSTP